ncbi:hypothetical protein OBBRIDRAFT_743469 [Obba rivulosa]|uniref:PH domain-containing protein n=1 Tax=Obba rivulosa TaxID=1052685 RepID=A0A8E2DVU8_9APHY|nr:hypothetical protein OBBRIDRAFT_743469 [Obba rivulosa]
MQPGSVQAMQQSENRAASTSGASVHALTILPSGPAAPGIICQGWALKKRRKRMQGFARRYFTLQQSGILSYSFEPGQPIRDQIALPQAAISTAPGRRDIHVDSGNATFHIKCLRAQDFNMWMSAFRKFLAQDSPTSGRRSSFARSIQRSGFYNRTGALVEEIGNTIDELQAAFAAWSEEDMKRRSMGFPRSKSSVGSKDHHKEHSGTVLGLFKKSHSHHSEYTPNHIADNANHQDTSTPYNRIQTALGSLRYQHAALAKLIPVVPSIDISSAPPAQGPPLPTTHEEDRPATPTTGFAASSPFKRMSIISNTSDGSGVWFDAPDGAEEFVLDSTPGDEVSEHKIFDTADHSTVPSDAYSTADAESGSESDSGPGSPEAPQPEVGNSQVQRRTQLPSPVVGDEGSLFAVLKKNVGKDLSQVALPVSFNEPLTLLQKIAEELEYYDLLGVAARTADPVERICYVAAFAVSSYANTKLRTGRKGFNPMLAETFEDPRMKFIAEKVSHNPVILAYHAEGEGWELYATSSGKTKFWGKSLEVIPQGTIHLKLGAEHYQWSRPSSFVRNIMMGTKYLEHCGKMTIENVSSGTRCILDFKESGYWGPSNIVSGTVFSPSGATSALLEGKWDEQMARKLDSSHLHVLWRMTPFSRNAPEYYGFTSFGVTLNEITPDLQGKLPPTDSRFRPDVRALEEGKLDLAEEEKARVEEMQRERRRAGAERKPRWFRQSGDEWLYVGGYWEQRAQGWKDVEPLW